MTSSSAVPDHSFETSRTLTRRASWFSIALSILLIICGFLGILLPIEMSFGVVIVASWLLMISGLLHFLQVFRCKDIGDGIWKALIAIVYFATGCYLRSHPGLGIAALTLALIAFLVAQGLIDVFVYFRMRRNGVSSWLLLNGMISLVLGLMIWRHWPTGSLWVVGTLVAINMIMTGATRLMLAVAGRRAINSSAGPHGSIAPPNPLSHGL